MFWYSAVWGVAMWLPAVAGAGQLDQFEELDAQMYDLHGAFVEAQWMATHAPPAAGSKATIDRRPDTLAKMDSLVTKSFGKTDGEEIATRTLFWAFTIDAADLPKRFRAFVDRYPDGAQMEGALQHIELGDVAADEPGVWVDALRALARTTKSKALRHTAQFATGHVQMRFVGLKEARATLVQLQKDAAETEIAKRAKGFVHEIDHLQVGMVAPDFTTTATDGKKVSLSSLRGKVVLLDYWATW